MGGMQGKQGWELLNRYTFRGYNGNYFEVECSQKEEYWRLYEFKRVHLRKELIEAFGGTHDFIAGSSLGRMTNRATPSAA
ncbi:MAG: hypothetical protein ABI478_00885 [Propionivibrio sp.]